MILGLGLLAALAGQAVDSPRPPEVAVVLLPGPYQADNARMLASLEQTGAAPGWFTAVPTMLARGALDGCLADADPEPCIRGVLRRTSPTAAPPVVVQVEGGPGFHVTWRCIGAGEGPTDSGRQAIGMDTLPWRAGPRERWEADRARAAACVLAAAAESEDDRQGGGR